MDVEHNRLGPNNLHGPGIGVVVPAITGSLCPGVQQLIQRAGPYTRLARHLVRPGRKPAVRVAAGGRFTPRNGDIVSRRQPGRSRNPDGNAGRVLNPTGQHLVTRNHAFLRYPLIARQPAPRSIHKGHDHARVRTQLLRQQRARRHYLLQPQIGMPGPYERAKTRPLRIDRSYSAELLLDSGRLPLNRLLVEPAAARQGDRRGQQQNPDTPAGT